MVTVSRYIPTGLLFHLFHHKEEDYGQTAELTCFNVPYIKLRPSSVQILSSPNPSLPFLVEALSSQADTLKLRPSEVQTLPSSR
ncbi:hypothetical protein F2Q68_00017444 [Brassica cretica]|uniref:Uncharacterized protein n=1 Tax=Brassica cretica TaxID=69181 RepID=A0A8S9HJ01_BRACR|nr:hypothetical protein F2Q68_00017444 [Brassica cretica]